MATDIFELSLITLHGTITSGHTHDKLALFRIFKNGVALTAMPAPIVDGKATTLWPTLPLGDLEDPYTLTFKMEVGSSVYPLAESYKVWPRFVVIKVIRDVDDKPFVLFKMKVKQGSEAVVLTDISGSTSHALAKTEPFTLEAVAPGEVVRWVQERGRNRVARAVRRYKAVFVKPEVPADGKPIEQLINLTTSDEGRDKKGSLVTIRVCAEGDAARPPADRIGHQGDILYLKAVFGRESKRNSPLPGLVDVLDPVRSADGKTVTGKVTLSFLGMPATFKLELGGAGGDTCTLHLGSTPACADAKMEFVNWRRLKYQLSLPSGLATPDMSFIEGSLAAVKVKYEKYKTVTFAEADTPAAPAGSWFDGSMVSAHLSGRCVNIGNHNRAFFHNKFVDTFNPTGVHVLVCHAQFDGGLGTSQLAHFDSPPILKTSAKVSFPITAGTPVFGWSFVPPNFNNQILEVAFQDGGNGWRNAKWKTLDVFGPNAGKSGTLPDDHVSVKWRTERNRVILKLPADAVALVNAGAMVVLSVDLYHSAGPYNGEADKHRQLIRTRAASEGGDKGMNGTMTHELGHTMGQVHYRVAPGLNAADHKRNYSARGHQGQHCADGLPQALYDGTDKLSGRTDCTCVMYGAGASTRPVTFCVRCDPYVRAVDLSNVTV